LRNGVRRQCRPRAANGGGAEWGGLRQYLERHLLPQRHISTAAASQLASAHARCGQGYVAAPVFGNPDAAKARQLFIVAAGAPPDVERCRPLLDQLGQRTFVVGDDSAHANLIKLMGNMLTATALEMLGETVALMRKRGLDPARFVELMTSTMFGGRVHRIYGERIVAQDYAAGLLCPWCSRMCTWRWRRLKARQCRCRR
jgi:3-hydroxyisobutyrate dehydrogenase-like beta-hydroxyacid dehydrogenase